MKRCDFTAEAHEDLRQIARYTKKKWGSEKARRYRHELELALQKLSLNPEFGRPREELSAGLRSFPAASHVAFYLPRDDGLVVIRLLHPRMDIQSALDSGGSDNPPAES